MDKRVHRSSRLLSEHDTAELSGWSVHSLRAWRYNQRSNKVRFPEPVKVGRRIYYDEAEVLSWDFPKTLLKK